MNERRVKKSHPDWEVLNKLSEDLARAVNAHVWFDLKDMPEKERTAVINKIKEMIGEELEGGIWKDFLNEGGGE